MDTQKGKDKVLPLRISYADWIDIAAAANADGIRTVSTWFRLQAILAASMKSEEITEGAA